MYYVCILTFKMQTRHSPCPREYPVKSDKTMQMKQPGLPGDSLVASKAGKPGWIWELQYWVAETINSH